MVQLENEVSGSCMEMEFYELLKSSKSGGAMFTKIKIYN